MAAEDASLEEAHDLIGQLRGELTQKEEQQEITTLIVDGQLTATGGTAAAPTLITTDTWHDTGALQNSWGKGSGYFKYKLLPDGLVAIAVKDIVPGTDTEGIVILSAANGLPAGYRPASNHRLCAYTDQQRLVVGSNVSSASLMFVTDGSVECFGIGGSATQLSCYGVMPIDI